MSGCPLSGSALAYASACSSHPHQPGTDALETLCPAAHACLSERAKELSDRDSSLLSIDLRPKSPPQATSLDCLLKTLRPRMQISTSAGLELANIDGDSCAASNDTNEENLLVSGSAADAGTDRDGHRIRLTLSHVRRIP
jgi:hypothetical protein